MNGIEISSEEIYEIAKEMNLNMSEKVVDEIIAGEKDSIKNSLREIIANKLEDAITEWK